MSKTASNAMTGLDIWGIVKNHISFDSESHAVEECTLHLDMTGAESYVEVHYYDLDKMPNVFQLNEEVIRHKFTLDIDATNNMYRDISQVVNIPQGVVSLHTHLHHHRMVYFDVKMVPLWK
jgi:hypothetical protein